MDCLFCRIRDREIPATFVYEDEDCFAIDDVNPQSPIHKLILPRRHLEGPNALVPADEALVGHLVRVAAKLALESRQSEEGYRLVVNCNQHGGQTVFHLHVHLLAGRQLTWPPG